MTNTRSFLAPASVLLLLVTLTLVGCTGENAADRVTTETAADSEIPPPPPPPPSDVMAAAKINLNSATKEVFLTVPGVGDRMVREFMEYRPYKSIGQFKKEIGKYVDEAQVEEYLNFLYVPVDPNSSDDDTVMQLPGVDESVIEELNLVKPFQSKDEFLTALSEFVTPEQLQQAETYLVEE